VVSGGQCLPEEVILYAVENSGTILLLGIPQFINNTGAHFHQTSTVKKSRLQWSGADLWETPHGGALF